MLKKLGDYYRDAIDGNIVLTKFLNFEEIKEISSLNKDNLKVYYYGGYDGAERVRAIIQNEYYEKPIEDDFCISIYQAKFKKEYQEIGHRNILGSIMSLGIERNTFGDIYINDNIIYLFVSREIENYLINNIPMIMHQRLEFKKIELFDESYLKKYSEIIIQVSSMRLDAVIARSLNISRNKSVEIIESGSVFINHLECKSITKQCCIGDMLSIRGFGRITIVEYQKTTKKGRLVLLIGVNH